jgi:outer membrane protein OmpA-like peptidoglycan-associated protein
MQKKSRFSLVKSRSSLLAVVAALAVAVPAMPQSKTSTSGSDGYPTIEIGVFGGGQWFRDKGVKKFEASPLVGFRFDESIADHWGLEESLTAGFNQLDLQPWATNSYSGYSERNYQLAVNPMFYFTRRQARVRPFLTVGPDYVWFVPSAPKPPFEAKNSPALVFGGGIKTYLTNNIAFRLDARGLWTRTPHFGLPSYGVNPGDLYLPSGGTEHALQLTAGFDFGFRRRGETPPPAPAPPPPPPPPPTVIAVGGIEGAHDVCPGEDERLQVAASGWAADKTATYQWMVDGQPVDGANGPAFSLPTAGASGTKSVSVKVTSGDVSKTSDPVTVRIKDYHAPTVQFSVSPSSIPSGAKAQLSSTATGSECGGATSVQYAASEGTISGDTFDSSGVQFDMSNRSKTQSKVVHFTATATDAKGGTGSATADLTVTLNPVARRLDDIVFPNLSARVNNCGKRLLLESLTPMLRDDPGATVILIGHSDTTEKGKAAAKLDETRVLDTAAVLSAGTGICPQLELSRVKVNWVGTDQSSTPQPSLCGESTNVKEKSGQAVKASDKRAEYRRVEVWFVPSGADMPAGLSGLKDAPAADIKAKGCPK